MKNCSKNNCTQTNPQTLENFNKKKSNKDGLNSICKTCDNLQSSIFRLKNPNYNKINSKKWRDENPQKSVESRLKYYNNNKEKCIRLSQKWSRNNPEKRQQISANRDKNNPDYANAKAMKHKVQKLNATPIWLTMEQLLKIKEFYTLAKELQWLSEEPLHVDHIVPLQGKNVCGLHVPWNLQILPRSQNCSKGNRI